MVNHVRTLLLNLRRAAAPYPAGEVYVPSDYIPAELPRKLLDVREALFGENPSRAGLNLLLARLLAYLHTSTLAADILAEDSRITYDPTNPSLDADPEATTHNLLAPVIDGLSESDLVFRPSRGSEARWLAWWQDDFAPSPLRVGAIALALAARTADVINGTYDG